VAFEFRYKAKLRGIRWLWDGGFVAGSYAAGFIQGTAVGALVEGLPIADGRYVGGAFGWASPFALLCGVGLCIGYAMIGACWLAAKTSEEVQAFAYRLLPRLLGALLAFLVVVFAVSVAIDLPVLYRWLERPVLFIFPVLGALAAFSLAFAFKARSDRILFPLAAVIFAAAFATLAVSFLPYMVPFSITIEQAAAPESSLEFLFWGAGLFVLPITIAYTAMVYFVFRGKVRSDIEYH